MSIVGTFWGIIAIVNTAMSGSFGIELDMTFLSIFLFAGICVLIKAKKEAIHAKQQLEAVEADCNAENHLFELMISDPERKNKKLWKRQVAHQIKTRKRFIKIHHTQFGKDHLNYLRHLLQEVS